MSIYIRCLLGQSKIIKGFMKLNKLQIKAEILTVLSLFQTEYDLSIKNIDKVVASLQQIEDTASLQEVLLKEFLKAEEQKALVISILLFRLCKKDDLEKALWEILSDKKIPDNAKLNSLNLLKDLGQIVDYQYLGKYFDNPNEIVDLDTKKLLESAIMNPESQIDFLDFIKSLSIDDAKLLINSLGRDYTMDDLANILSPVFLHDPYSEIGLLALEILAETKSKIALNALIEAQDFIENEEILNKIKKAISTLKIAGIRSSDLKSFYQEILSSSKPFQFYTSYPDGRGNQALIFSRMKANESIQMFAVITNDRVGILDCFGFNEISADEFDRIISRFYNKNQRIYINPHQLKTLLARAEKLSRKVHFKIPYEYICWKTLLADIDEENTPF